MERDPKDFVCDSEDYGRAREGDYVETFDGHIFDVKGLVHPPRKVIAYLKYVPDLFGERVRLGVRYTKVYDISQRIRYVRTRLPQYLIFDPFSNMLMMQVPWSDIAYHYRPRKVLDMLWFSGDLDLVENDAIELVTLLVKHGVSRSSLGISGSLLLGLHTPSSDIDLIVYGRRASQAAYEVFEMLCQTPGTGVRKYDDSELSKLYEFRYPAKPISIEEFAKVERRKPTQGFFRGREFFTRFVKSWGEVREVYGDAMYVPVGYAEVVAEVEDDSDSLFTPCRYVLKNAKVVNGPRFNPIRELISYRGRFSASARVGERILFRGKVEQVFRGSSEPFYRVMIGENPADYLKLVD